MKKCSRCKQEKQYADFCKMSRSKDGYQPACKTCMADSWRQSRNKKLDHYKDVQKKRTLSDVQKAKDWKFQHGCSLCEEREPECLELHHLDPTTKEGDPSAFIRISFNSFLKEAEKCVLLCANCHRKVHSGKLKLSVA